MSRHGNHIARELADAGAKRAAEEKQLEADAELGRLLRETFEAWPEYRLKFYRDGQIELDPFPNVSTTASCVGFTERDNVEALRAAILAAGAEVKRG